MQTLHIPASYDVWLTGLKHHLDRHRGSKAALARHLAQTRGWQEKGAVVTLSKILRQDGTRPGVDVFLDIAAWLQQRQDALEDPALPEDTPIPPRQAVTYWQTQPPAKAKVAEDQARAGE